jgi:hypothetical protein
VPDEVVVEMVKSRLAQRDVEINGWLLDGYPRSSSQALAIEKEGIRPDVFLLIEVRATAQPAVAGAACQAPIHESAAGCAEQSTQAVGSPLRPHQLCMHVPPCCEAALGHLHGTARPCRCPTPS